jgi:hypothetical protein
MFNPKVTNIAVPAAGAPPVAIVLTQTDTFVVIQEDPNVGDAQGLVGTLVDPQAPQEAVPPQSATQKWPPNTGQQGPAFQPIELGDPRKVHAGIAPYLGSEGTIVAYLNSATATPTGLALYEWN